MGQSVTVVRKSSSRPEVVRFEINRSLTGMGHERYRSLADVVRNRPVDVLARRLLEHGGVEGVHVNSSVITVDLAGGSTGDGLDEVIRDLFRFYGDEPAEPEGAPVDAEGPPTDRVPEPDAAEAPESAVDSEVAAQGSLADRSDAPSAVDPTKPTPDPSTPTGVETGEDADERDAEAAAARAASPEGAAGADAGGADHVDAEDRGDITSGSGSDLT
jgi:hypothetical protein